MNAHYFDGVDARLHVVTLAVADGQVTIRGDGFIRQAAIASTCWSAPSITAPAMLYLADGALCEMHGSDRVSMARALGQRPPGRMRRYLGTLAAVLALATLVAVTALTAWRLFPALADLAARTIPAREDQRVGEWVLAEMIDNQTLQPSRIAPGLAREAAQMLEAVGPPQPRVPIRLRIFRAPTIGINAFQLPDGTMVLTDQLVGSIAGNASTLNATQRAMLAGVLAHEIGHLQARDMVRGVVGGSLMKTLSAALLGEFSDGVAAFSSDIMNLHYSRDREQAADEFAIRRMQQAHLPLTPLADWFDALDAWETRMADGKHSEAHVYFSTHPATLERAARFRAADRN